MRKLLRLVYRVAIVTLAGVILLAILGIVVIAVLAIRVVLPPSLGFLAVPLVLLLIGIGRMVWPEVRKRYGPWSRNLNAGRVDDPKPSNSSDAEARPAANSPIDPDYVACVMGQAAQLPILDAAFHLWTRKSRLDRSEGLLPSPKSPPSNLGDPEMFGKAIREAIRNLDEERANAHTGPTFLRLRKLYPDASPEELQQSIRAAVKLDDDCTRNFSYKSTNYLDDVTAAVDIARQANPEFQEETYKAAWHDLATAMR